jgi:hypothetical protein
VQVLVGVVLGVAGIVGEAFGNMAVGDGDEVAGTEEGRCIVVVEILTLEIGAVIARWCLLLSVQRAVLVFDTGSR